MSFLKKFSKLPDDVQDYDIEFADWLDFLSDSGVSVQTEVPDGLQLLASTLIGSRVKVWVSGGTAGELYPVTSTLTTQDGRVKQVSIGILVTAPEEIQYLDQ